MGGCICHCESVAVFKDLCIIDNALRQKIKTDHTSNEYINNLLTIALNAENLNNPHGNKNIPDNLIDYATQKYDIKKNEVKNNLNADIDIILNSITYYLLYRYRTIDTLEIITKHEIKLKKNLYLTQLLIDNWKIYCDYLFLLLNQITGLAEIIFLGVDKITCGNVYIMFTTTTILKRRFPYQYKSFIEILDTLFNKYYNIGWAKLKILIYNITIIEKVKDKLIYFNEYITLTIKKIDGIDNLFLDNIYTKYLEDKFMVNIISINDQYTIGLEYKI